MFILAITPGTGFDGPRWRAVLRSGVDGFFIREKHLEARALLDATRWCQDTAPEVELWVGGRLDIALAAGCGLHAPEAYPEVPASLVPLSRPLHEEGQFEGRRACRQLLIAPVLATPGKGAPWGAARLHRFLTLRRRVRAFSRWGASAGRICRRWRTRGWMAWRRSARFGTHRILATRWPA